MKTPINTSVPYTINQNQASLIINVAASINVDTDPTRYTRESRF